MQLNWVSIFSGAVQGRVCPGKNRIDRNRFLSMMEDAVEIFGNGHVWCNLVCGLEPLENQLEAYSVFASKGIVCGANIFHRDPLVTVDAITHLTEEAVREYYSNAASVLHQYSLAPFYSMESRRSSLLWEAYYGLL